MRQLKWDNRLLQARVYDLEARVAELSASRHSALSDRDAVRSAARTLVPYAEQAAESLRNRANRLKIETGKDVEKRDALLDEADAIDEAVSAVRPAYSLMNLFSAGLRDNYFPVIGGGW
jgi:hypothetical protein